MRLLESVRKIDSSRSAPPDLSGSGASAEGRRGTGAVFSADASCPKPSRIVIQAPLRLDQTEGIVDILQSGCSVLLNLQGGSAETARRLLDFIAGFAYHNENKVWKIARNTFLIVPFDAEVQAVDFPKYIVA